MQADARFRILFQALQATGLSLSLLATGTLRAQAIGTLEPRSSAQAGTPSIHTLIERRQWPEAEKELLRAAADRQRDGLPDEASSHFLLGFVLFHENRFAESLAEYTKGAKFAAPASADLMIVASDYIQLKDYVDAEHWLLRVTADTPADATAWYLLGRTQYLLDHAEAAAASFHRCLALDRRNLRAQYNLGLALERLERMPDAIAAYQAAIAWEKEDGSRDPQPYLDLGSLLLKLDRGGEALAPLEQAVALDPRNPMAQQQLGIAYERAGRDPEAIAAYERAAALAPDAEHPHYFLGRLLRKTGQKPAADAQFAIVARLLAGSSDRETPNRDAGAQTLTPPLPSTPNQHP